MGISTWLTAWAGAALVLVSLAASMARSECTAAGFAISRCETEALRLERRLRWIEVELAGRLADPSLRWQEPEAGLDLEPVAW